MSINNDHVDVDELAPGEIIEWAVMKLPNTQDVYRGPLSETEARTWIAENDPDHAEGYYAAHRHIGPWILREQP